MTDKWTIHDAARRLSALAFIVSTSAAGAAAPVPPAAPSAPETPAVRTADLKVPFILNDGQMASDVAFYAPMSGGAAFVTTSGEMVHQLGAGRVVRERLVSARPAHVRGGERAATTVNVFRGSDPAAWRRNLPSYDVVTLGEVYDGIEVTLHAYGGRVEKLFHVKPGATTRNIRVALDGVSRVEHTGSGTLDVHTPGGVVTFSAPVAYQEVDGVRSLVLASYAVDGLEYGFDVGSYDRAHPLVIDPIVSATFLGGSGDEVPWSLAVDASDNVYVAGETSSMDFPLVGPGSADAELTSGDGFVARLNPSLSAIVSATFLGGSGYESINAVAVDATGVYVAGGTHSSDFPGVGPGSADGTFADTEAFVAKLDAGLGTLIGATFLGGLADDAAGAVMPDAGGNVYVGGWTESYDFPGVTSASADSLFTAPGDSEAFVALLDGTLTTVVAATYLGGSGTESVRRLAIDPGGNVYAAGTTSSTAFPGVNGGSADATAVGNEVFVVRLHALLGSVLSATFVGGSGSDGLWSMTLNAAGDVYVAGSTESADLPGINVASADHTLGLSDGFVARLTADLSAVAAATYLGGADFDVVTGVVIGEGGNVYVAGQTTSTDLPGINNGSADDTLESSEAFLAVLDPALLSVYSTYIGGNGDDYALGLARGASDVYVTGGTTSAVFPGVGPGSADSTLASVDGFVARLSSVDDPIASAFTELKEFIEICWYCPPDPASELLQKINEAVRYYRAGDERLTVNALRQFIDLTRRYTAGGLLPRDQGARFIGAAEQILAELAAMR